MWLTGIHQPCVTYILVGITWLNLSGLTFQRRDEWSIFFFKFWLSPISEFRQFYWHSESRLDWHMTMYEWNKVLTWFWYWTKLQDPFITPSHPPHLLVNESIVHCFSEVVNVSQLAWLVNCVNILNGRHAGPACVWCAIKLTDAGLLSLSCVCG